MRRIAKDAEPSDLSKSKVTYHNDWSSVPGELKKRWGEQLVEEQRGLDAYTEEILLEGLRHIDHYRKRELYPQETFAWANLLLANHGHHFGADAKDSRIRGRGDYDLLVDPVIDEAQSYFRYNTRGEILPSDELSDKQEAKALHTIETFALNHPSLVRSRKSVRGTLLSYGEEAACFLEMIRHGDFKMPFVSMIEALVDESIDL